MSLPSGYKRLEYIQSTGTQYIDTLVNIEANKPITLRVVCDCSFNNVSVGNGVGTTISGNIFYFGTYKGKYCYGLGTVDGVTSVAADTQRRIYDLDAPGKKFTVSDKLSLTELSFATPTASRTFWLPQWGNGIKLYSCQIYDNSTLIRDYTPCQKPDGTIGLWDDVNSVFYGNAGTGTFTAGPVIAIAADASEITKLEYIQSTGAQHLDTLFKPNNHTRVVIDFRSTFSTANSPKGLLGSRNSSDVGMFAFLYSNRIDPNYNGVGKSVTVDSLQRHVYDFNQNSFSVDGAVVSFDAGVFSPGYNLLLLSVQNYGTIDNRKAEGYLYSCQIYDNNTIIRDYIPAKLSDGTVGLYDKLNGLLYINAGTGTFEAGPSSLNLPVNIGGTWKDANEAFVNIGGTWKTVKDAFVNIDGTWKELG